MVRSKGPDAFQHPVGVIDGEVVSVAGVWQEGRELVGAIGHWELIVHFRS